MTTLRSIFESSDRTAASLLQLPDTVDLLASVLDRMKVMTDEEFLALITADAQTPPLVECIWGAGMKYNRLATRCNETMARIAALARDIGAYVDARATLMIRDGAFDGHKFITRSDTDKPAGEQGTGEPPTPADPPPPDDTSAT